jgi:cell division protein FtsB
LKLTPFKKWTIRQRILGISALVLMLVILPVFGSILSLWHNKSELRRLTKRRNQLDARYEQLLAEKKRLEDQDPAYMEQLARVRYNMVKPGEIEYRFTND